MAVGHGSVIAAYSVIAFDLWANELDFDDKFAGVAAGEEHVDGVGSFLQAFHDGFAVLDFPKHFPLAELRGRFHEARGIVENNEALHAQAFHQHGAEASQAGILLGVAGNEPTENDAAVKVHEAKNSVHDFAANILK